MKICVCVKHVPDPNLPVQVDPATRRLIRDPKQSIIDPADEYGVETALRLVEEHGGEVVAVTMGPPAAEDALRRAMAMGADRAILVSDEALAGSDVLGTARALAAAIRPEQPDLVICATESTDAYTGLLPGALAGLLDLPQLTFARAVSVEGSTVTVQRATETGYQVIQATLPALVTVTASVGEPRYPSFKGLMAAKRKPIEVRDIAELGLEQHTVGEPGARERVLEISAVRQVKQGRIVVDDGTGESVEEILAFLRSIQVV
ncbi:electron transfer flavoprotein subunit beta/FixA family protein [Thermomicrobiaceae bacterium CFH 74404]|uniref:Electron transfer flavoprotein subunit beta/FixA family protein n=1 Tax=Thermalbibacter longus TaxID=2951981 RepID=A0AA42BAF0_9BACT|nr:electron transfer flavoprotein subunit beta/FixA family protein [Thermalbibacter longus]MCM8749776.1 electron transfer flavoprotein subunit beta/FixA family protein [Thermalbibacter longus]